MAAGELRAQVRIYLIADFTAREDDSVLTATERCLRAGVRVIQYRNKRDDGEHADLCRILRHMTRRHDALLIINDDVDLALSVGADGVHLGPNDMPPAQARQALGEHAIVGGSAGDVDRARALVAAGCDYLGVGAIFEARATKPNASPPRGPDVLQAVRAAVGVPIVAIGGIDPDNAAQALSAGADGVAMIRGLLDAPDPAAVVHALKRL